MLNNYKESLDSIQRIADSQKLIAESKMIDNVRKLLKNQNIYVPFIGCHSSGKSSLLNALLRISCLPVGVLPVTPTLTYISRGPELAVLHIRSDAGDCEDEIRIAPEFMKLVRADAESEYIQLGQSDGKTINVNSVTEIDINLDNDAIGDVVLIDTPGLNVLDEKHEAFTRVIMPDCATVVYVFGGALTNADKNNIQMLDSLGCKISFVRTHMEAIKPGEDTISGVISKDIAKLAEIAGKEQKEVVYFCTAGCDFGWKCGVPGCELADFEKYLFDNIIVNARAELARFVAKKTIRICDSMTVEIGNSIGAAERLLSKSLADLEEERGMIKSKIKNCSEQIANLTLQTAVKRKNAILALREAMGRFVSDIERGQMNALPPDVTADNLSEFINGQVSAIKEKLIECAEQETVRILSVFDADCKEGVKRIFDDLKFDLPGEYVFDVEELTQDNEEATVIKRQIDMLSTHLPVIRINDSTVCAELEAALSELDDEISRIMDDERAIGQYIPEYNIVKDESAEQKMRRIGAMLDWAMIVLPEGAIIRAVAGAGKVAKIAAAASKSIRGMETVAKGLKTFSEYSQKEENISRQVNKIRSRKGEVESAIAASPFSTALDMITIEYWFGKIGKQFSAPDKLELDTIHQKEYLEAKRAITDQAQQAVRKRIDIVARIAAVKNENDRMLLEQQIKYEADAMAKRELERQLRTIEEQILRRRLNEKYDEIKLEFHRSAVAVVEDLLIRTASVMEGLSERNLQQTLKKLNDDLHRQQQQLDTLVSGYDDRKTSLEQDITDQKGCQGSIDEIKTAVSAVI